MPKQAEEPSLHWPLAIHLRRITLRRCGLVLALLAVCLRLAAPTVASPPLAAPASPLAELEGILGGAVVELCLHSGESTDPSGDPANPAPGHRLGHDCIACCSPASLAAVLPQAVPVPLPREDGTVETIAPASAGPSLSVFAIRQRGPPAA